MTTYNTGNPIGSTAVKDLYDNAENLDTAVNDTNRDTWSDRLGQQRKTWNGMEREFSTDQADRDNRFNNFIASSGYQFLGDYAAGIEITEYNHIVRDADGEFWRVSGQVDLPYTTTGAGLPENDAFVSVGDAALRQELAMPGGAALVGQGVMAANTIADLLALPAGQRKADMRYLVKEYHEGTGVGGGEFYWDAASTAADNGGTVFVVSGVATGRIVRRFGGPVNVTWFGAGIGGDDTTAIQRALNFAASIGAGEVFIPGGNYHIEAHRNSPTERTRFGIDVPSNMRIRLSPDAVLRVIPNDRESYAVFRVMDKENVIIHGGQFIGDKMEHTYVGSQEWGYGIAIRGGSKSVVIQDARISHMMGDGVYVRCDEGEDNAIRVRDCVITNCRRHEITVASVSGLTVEGCTLTKTDEPKDGVTNTTYGGLNIDIEPSNTTLNRVRNILLRNNSFHCVTNACVRSDTRNNFVQNLKILDNEITGTCEGIGVNGALGVVIGRNHIRNMLVSEGWGIQMKTVSRVSIHDNRIEDCKRLLNIVQESTRNADITIRNNDIKAEAPVVSAAVLSDIDKLAMSGNVVDVTAAGSSSMLSIQNSSDVSVAANSLSLNGFGVRLNNVVQATLSGNTMSKANRLLDVAGASASVTVRDNDFIYPDTVTAAFYVRQAAETECLYIGNRFRNPSALSLPVVIQLASGATAKATGNDFTGAASNIAGTGLTAGGNFLVDGNFS